MNKHFSSSALLCCAMLMSACGGGGGAETPAPGTPPVVPVTPPVVPVTPPVVPETPPVVPVTPPVVPKTPPTVPVTPVVVRLDAPVWSNDGAAVTRAKLPAASFAAVLDASTVNTASVQVVGPEGNPMPGTAFLSAPDGKMITWTPAAGKLPGGTNYEIRLSTAIRDTAGLSMDSAVSKPFGIAPQQWSRASGIVGAKPYHTSGVNTTLVADKAGNVTALWYYSVSSVDQVFASRLDKASGTWSAPQTIHGVSTSPIGGLNAVAAANGDVFVAWTDYEGSAQKVVMARYFAAGGAWEKPVHFNGMPAGINATGASMAIDGKGTITVVFKSSAGNALYAARYETANRSWGLPFRIDVPNPDNYFVSLRLLADQAGNVTVGWLQRSTPNWGLNLRRYSAATSTWGEVKNMDANFAAQDFDMAVDAHGGITLVWTHGGMMMDTPYVAASVFDPATSLWSTPTRVSGIDSVSGLAAGHPSVVRSNSGVSTVVWWQENAAFSARLAPSSLWSAPQRVGDLPFQSGAFALGIDIAGNVTAAYPNGASMMAVHYSASAKVWGTAAALGAPEGETAAFTNAASVVVDATGAATAVWQGQTTQGGIARYRVLSNRFD